MSETADDPQRHFSRCHMIDPEHGRPVVDLIPAAVGTVAAHSSRAPGYERDNQDAAAVVPIDDQRAVLIVADGVGGHASGHAASALAVDALSEAVLAAAETIHDEPSLRGAILDGIDQANQAVLALGVGAATTLLVVEIQGPLIRPFHVGDSQALLVGQRGKVKLETMSHSPVGYAVESGILDAEAAIEHEHRHIVSNLVGSSDMRIEIGSAIEMARRDTLVLATDGLFDNLYLSEIISGIRTGKLDASARDLAGLCRQRMTANDQDFPSKPDDLTVLLYRRR